MPKCEQCGREFSTDEGLAQHNRDKHGIGKVTKHEFRQMKKEEKEKRKLLENKKRSKDKMAKYSGIAVGLVVVIAALWLVFSSAPQARQSESPAYDLSGIPPTFVHWHADVDVVICGEEQRLPEAISGGLIGDSKLHTHDQGANIASLPGSDGNGVIHSEGNIAAFPQDHTLEKFMRNIGVKFSSAEIMGKKNGDTCGGESGSVKVFLNDQPLEDFLNYIPRDRDFIRIEFS